MSRVSEQVEWLSLVDISGPFLVPAVLEQVFPQGLEKVQTPRRQRLRSAYEEWRDAVDDDDAQLPEMHSAWVLMVLQDMLEYEDTVLVARQSLDGKGIYQAPEHGVEYAPDYAVTGEDGKLRLPIAIWPPETDLEKAPSGDSWTASPLERMTLLCRATNTRLGLVTDGERWMLVNAPVGATSGYAAWLARLWWQEPVTLKAFQSLLGVRRFFGPKEETLEALLEKSAEFQEEVTDTLGEQVRRAVEILVQSLGRADQDRNGELLKDVRPAELYEAGLTIMMRMVFTLCAEERGLLLLGDPVYDQHYALSTLRVRLREDADRNGVEVLERRHDAWSRMLAIFRAIYGGVEHESLRMPALGGSLFDPDRFPLLEGRAKGTSWRDTPSVPLPIDNRTVLLLLDALQLLEQKGGAQLLSYRALDVEQIGHVYEGLLEYTVAKLDKVIVGLIGSQRVRHPSIALTELESLKSQGIDKAVESLAEMTGRSPAAIRRALDKSGDNETLVRLVHACGGDEKLAKRILSFADLIRADSWGTLLVYKPGSFAVVHGSDRRETGTHYTPKSLTESIVEKTLEPIVYSGPADGEPRERWKLKTPSEILDLKVCDPAMGSGAFLVQVCRYLAERLVEAWRREEAAGKAITADGVVLDTLGKADPLPKSLDERLVIARRLIAERCLYGVDINSLAVELAKLSIWLVTMAKGRPFGFLDHNLRRGDSLLGIHRLDQLTKLTMNPDEAGHQQRLFGQNIRKAVEEAMAIRAKLRSIPIRDIRDVEMMTCLNAEARNKLEAVELLADAMIGAVLANCTQRRSIQSALDALAAEAGELLNGDADAGKNISRDANRNLSTGLPDGRPPRRPFHWAFAFPEVFGRGNGGFDCVLANPPFVDSETMTRSAPLERGYISCYFSCAQGNWDLFVPFIQRALMIGRHSGVVSLISPNKWLGAPYGAALRAHTQNTLLSIFDFSGSRAFPGIGVAAICSTFSKNTKLPITVWRYSHLEPGPKCLTVARDVLQKSDTWGILLSAHADVLLILSASGVRLGAYVDAHDPFTVSEAYELKNIIVEQRAGATPSFKFVNTGTIDPYVTLWGISETRYLKSRFSKPVIGKETLKRLLPRRYAQACKPKLILSGMRKFEAFLDQKGEYVAGKSSIVVIPKDARLSLMTCLGLLNSMLIRFFIQESFGVLGIDGGISFSGAIVEGLPLPKGFAGRIPAVEDAVRVVLDNVAGGEVDSESMNLVDAAIFAAYGISDAQQRLISACDLRC